MLFVCLFLVLVLVPSLVIKKLPNPMARIALNFRIRRVSVGRPERGSTEALRTLQPFALQTNVTSSVISLCSSSFTTSPGC